MRQLALTVAFTLLTSAAVAKGEPPDTKGPQAPAAEKTMTQAELDALLQQVLESVKQTGLKDVGVVPMFVFSGTEANGKRMLLLVDPGTMQAIEVRDEADVASRAGKRPRSGTKQGRNR